jgi:hypothetical protein
MDSGDGPMKWPRAELLLVLLALAGLPAAPAAAKRAPIDPAARCVARKLAASSAGAAADLQCHGKAAAKGQATDPGCLVAVRQKLARAFEKAERPGDCAANGDVDGVAAGLETRAGEVAVLLRPAAERSKCASVALRAIGAGAKALYRARAKFAVQPDQAKLAGARAQVRERLARALGKAAKKGDCDPPLDVAATAGLAERVAGLAGALRVRVEAVKQMRIPEAVRGEFLAARGAVEGNGFTLSDDGSLLAGPAVSAGGWLVSIGGGRGRSDGAGTAIVDVPAGAPFEGEVFHPADETFVVGPVFLNDLVPDGEAVQTILFELTNDGPCGMNHDAADDSSQCTAAAPAARAHSHAEPSMLNPNPALFPGRITMELGTYPNPDPAAAQIACLDYDGIIESHTDRGETSATGVIAYPGSTCFVQVELGCCDNEAADVRRRLANAFLDPREFPLLHCPDNHKGRFCQSLTKGDVSIKVRGDVLKAGQKGEYEVASGEMVPITVHNNGCYGDSHVNDGFLSSFLPLGGHLSGTALEGTTIKHYVQNVGGGIASYTPDQTITYTAPSPCPHDGLENFRRDRYAFETDGSHADVEFKCPPTTTTTLACIVPGTDGFTRAACTAPIVDWVGTSHWVHDESDLGFSQHEDGLADFTLTNDPAINSTGSPDVFVPLRGNVTYSYQQTSGVCTLTVDTTQAAVTPFPGGIPSLLQIARLPDGTNFVTASLIEGLTVSEREECPPNPPQTTLDGAPVPYLVIPLVPAFHVSGDGQSIAGSFSDGVDSWEWSLTRTER